MSLILFLIGLYLLGRHPFIGVILILFALGVFSSDPGYYHHHYHY